MIILVLDNLPLSQMKDMLLGRVSLTAGFSSVVAIKVSRIEFLTYIYLNLIKAI